MNDPQGIEPEVQPRVKTDQELHPPRRFDDADQVAEDEKRFGMSMWIGIVVIALIFLIVLIWIWV